MFKFKKRSVGKLLITYNNFQLIIGVAMVTMQIILTAAFYQYSESSSAGAAQCPASADSADQLAD